VRQRAFKEGTIRSAWEKAGLIPLNPGKVLSQMKAISAPQREIKPEDQIIDWTAKSLHQKTRQKSNNLRNSLNYGWQWLFEALKS